MKPRRSIHVEGFSHGNLPIPAASRVGNIIATGGIPGISLSSGTFPPDAATQTANAFALLTKILIAAGATPAEVVKVTVFVKDPVVREHVNREWLAMFPDPQSRPARHTLQHDLAVPMLVQLEALAVATGEDTASSDG